MEKCNTNNVENNDTDITVIKIKVIAKEKLEFLYYIHNSNDFIDQVVDFLLETTALDNKQKQKVKNITSSTFKDNKRFADEFLLDYTNYFYVFITEFLFAVDILIKDNFKSSSKKNDKNSQEPKIDQLQLIEKLLNEIKKIENYSYKKFSLQYFNKLNLFEVKAYIVDKIVSNIMKIKFLSSIVHELFPLSLIKLHSLYLSIEQIVLSTKVSNNNFFFYLIRYEAKFPEKNLISTKLANELVRFISFENPGLTASQLDYVLNKSSLKTKIDILISTLDSLKVNTSIWLIEKHKIKDENLLNLLYLKKRNQAFNGCKVLMCEGKISLQHFIENSLTKKDLIIPKFLGELPEHCFIYLCNLIKQTSLSEVTRLINSPLNLKSKPTKSQIDQIMNSVVNVKFKNLVDDFMISSNLKSIKDMPAFLKLLESINSKNNDHLYSSQKDFFGPYLKENDYITTNYLVKLKSYKSKNKPVLPDVNYKLDDYIFLTEDYYHNNIKFVNSKNDYNNVLFLTKNAKNENIDTYDIAFDSEWQSENFLNFDKTLDLLQLSNKHFTVLINFNSLISLGSDMSELFSLLDKVISNCRYILGFAAQGDVSMLCPELKTVFLNNKKKIIDIQIMYNKFCQDVKTNNNKQKHKVKNEEINKNSKMEVEVEADSNNSNKEKNSEDNEFCDYEIISSSTEKKEDITELEVFSESEEVVEDDDKNKVHTVKSGSISLKDLTVRLLGKKLCKQETLSNWKNPKLRNAQVHYAALDAYILHDLYDKVLKLKV